MSGRNISEAVQAYQAYTLGRKTIQAIDEVVNLAVSAIILLSIAFSGYAIWDSRQVYEGASNTVYAAYKPSADDDHSAFLQFQTKNEAVIAWLYIPDTDIDYPVMQGLDNLTYTYTDVEGRYSQSGAIFLDCNNNGDFGDFNSILYGHRMGDKTMFGEIGGFAHQDVFDAHPCGALFFADTWHTVAFFAFIHTSAYDDRVFRPGVTGESERSAYLEYLMEKALHGRKTAVTTDDRLVLLSTCSPGSTNGRDILVGLIQD